MAMTANKVADTSRLAEARRVELGWAAGEGSVIGAGNKRLFRERWEAYPKRAAVARGLAHRLVKFPCGVTMRRRG
jgi:hypothetical protein